MNGRNVPGACMVTLGALALGALAGCIDLGNGVPTTSLGDGGAAGDAGPADGGPPVTHFIQIQGFAWCDADGTPCDENTRIRAGDTVTWTNGDAMFHIMKEGDFLSPPPSPRFESPPIATGMSWSFTFDEVGDFEYFCDNHAAIMNRAHILVEP